MSVVARHELLAAATPRPWHQTGLGIRFRRGGLEPALGSTYETHDAKLIVATVNEYEALLACESGLRALVGLLRPDNRHAIHARDALERLDDIRDAKETRT